MRPNKLFKSSLIISAVAILTACASVPKGDPAKDTALKTFQAPSDKAGIYVYRNESFGGAIKMSVAIDDQIIGNTGPNTYLYQEVTPGVHKVTGKAENTSDVIINAVAGKLYYVWQEVKLGIMMAQNRLSVVDETSGQKGVKETTLTVLEGK